MRSRPKCTAGQVSELNSQDPLKTGTERNLYPFVLVSTERQAHLPPLRHTTRFDYIVSIVLDIA